MSGLDDALVTALRDKADAAARLVDTKGARAAVQARLDRVDHGRRRRVWLVPVAVGAAVAAVAIAAVAGRSLHQATPLPPTHPSPTSTLLSLAGDPFLTDGDLTSIFFQGIARNPTTPTRPLSPCLPDPRTWGAVQSKAAAYPSRTDPTVTLNEYVLRFTDPAAAHTAVLNAWARLHACSSQFDQPLAPPGPNIHTPYLQDVVFGQDSRHGFYVPRIARVGNVVVVVEDTGISDDRSWTLLDLAMNRASPQYAAFGPKSFP